MLLFDLLNDEISLPIQTFIMVNRFSCDNLGSYDGKAVNITSLAAIDHGFLESLPQMLGSDVHEIGHSFGKRLDLVVTIQVIFTEIRDLEDPSAVDQTVS